MAFGHGVATSGYEGAFQGPHYVTSATVFQDNRGIGNVGASGGSNLSLPLKRNEPNDDRDPRSTSKKNKFDGGNYDMATNAAALMEPKESA